MGSGKAERSSHYQHNDYLQVVLARQLFHESVSLRLKHDQSLNVSSTFCTTDFQNKLMNVSIFKGHWGVMEGKIEWLFFLCYKIVHGILAQARRPSEVEPSYGEQNIGRL